MTSVLIRPEGCVDRSGVLELSAGAEITFGRGAPGHPVGLRLDHPGVSRLAGRILAGRTYWFLTNASRRAVYLVENAEEAGEYLKVGPGRAGLPVPFEISTVVLPAGQETVSFQVYAPEQPAFIDPVPGHLPGACTASPFPLDRSAKYFLVLVALCEPRLRGRALAPLPSAAQVAERLRQLPGCGQLTGRAVDFHVDYLARVKLRLHPGDPGVAGRREALVGFALRFGLVCADDLALLARPELCPGAPGRDR